jgi:hypothetical protein
MDVLVLGDFYIESEIERGRHGELSSRVSDELMLEAGA